VPFVLSIHAHLCSEDPHTSTCHSTKFIKQTCLKLVPVRTTLC